MARAWEARAIRGAPAARWGFSAAVICSAV